MHEADMPSVYEVSRIARRTLSRNETDTRPVPPKYMEQLLQHLQLYPNETEFLMDLDEHSGAITCLHCFEEILVGIDDMLPFFQPFWDHLETQQHKIIAAAAEENMNSQGTYEDPMDVDDFDLNEVLLNQYARPDPVPPPSSNTTPTRRRIKRHFVLSDGETVEYSTDEDTPQLTSQPYAGTNHNPFASSSHIHPAASAPTLVANLPEQSTPTTVQHKRPRRGYRKYEFGDGEVFYLSTDDETVDERPRHSPEKKPKLGGALIKSRGGINATSTPVLPTTQSSSSSARQETSPTISQWSSLSGWNKVQRSDQPVRPDPAPSNARHIPRVSFAGSHNALAGPSTFGKDPIHLYKNNYAASIEHPQDALDTSNMRIPGGFPTFQQFQRHQLQNVNAGYDVHGAMPNMGFHAPPISMNYGKIIPNGMPGLPHMPMPMNQNPAFDPTQKFKDFFLTAMEDFQEAPKVMDAAKKLDMENTNSFLPGLEVKLMPHQLIGVSWMLEQEKKPTKGGILADDMGLGKTLQCIATCVKNRPPPGTEKRSTLVVAPAALLNQWKNEILQRTNAGLFRVHIHHSKDKLRSVTEVNLFDFVITTYQTLCLEYPRRKKIGPDGEELPQYSSDDSDDEDNQRMRGPLAKTEWYRVILDEAQFIRNRKTRSSKCVARLKSTYRWILTGTPVVNTLEDLYPQIRFLQMHPFDEWREFKNRIVSVQKNPKLAGDRAQAMLNKCLLRRTKDTKLEGKAILQLPPKDVEIVQIDFSTEERQIYDRIERREQLRMTKFLKAGTVLKNYMIILVMLLRLRQACNHPLLIASDAEDPNDFNTVLDEADTRYQKQNANANDLERAEKSVGPVYVKEVKAKLLAQAEARIKAETQGLALEEEDTECPICYDSYINNCCITKCKHMFCADCLNDLFKSPLNNAQAQDAEYARAVQSGIRPCPVCRNNIHPDDIFRTSFFEPTESEINALRGIQPNISTSSDVTTPVDVKGKGKAADDDANIDDILEDLHNDAFEPSAKMLQMVALLKQWKEEVPDDKVICYSQWTSMISLVERLLDNEGFQTVRYDGQMSRTERDNAVTAFKKRSGPSIMLISLKCGGVGLNLVEANRVLCLDLAWNAATEHQAFDRVHRMGQQKNVFVKRLIVRNTVEDRILKLQASKQALSDAALGEGTAGKLKKLTVGELKALFGLP